MRPRLLHHHQHLHQQHLQPRQLALIQRTHQQRPYPSYFRPPLTLHLSLLLQGYSFPANQYPFLTIVISLKVTAYVQSLSLGPQSNVQRYGLRLYNPARNVDDTYYSSTDSTSGQPMISGIPMAKVAVRLYINLYTTSDGRPPSNLQLTFVSGLG